MKTKQDIFQWLDENAHRFTEISDGIWLYPEVAFKEFRASKLQTDFLTAEGFKITWDIGGLNTAFMAEWGEGRPIIAFIGEYDALLGLSQKNQPTQEPLVPGDPGHACGHNLLGTGCMASVVAVKKWLESNGDEGTVRYYGCPAEERLTGKTFMARSGAFDDLDAAFNFHPGRINRPFTGSSVGLYDLSFRFYGTAAHAGAAPHKGRSALDAVELMNVGVNYLREHVTEKVRIHYVIKNGGDLPNIVPTFAEVWYFLRAHESSELKELAERVHKVAQGAALMTDTRMEMSFNGACSNVLNNHYLAELQYKMMDEIGPIRFNEEEKAYAAKINENYSKESVKTLFKGLKMPKGMEDQLDDLKNETLLGINFPPVYDNNISTGSTDVGDVSWITPLSILGTACTATGAQVHDWSFVATCGMSIGHKGMIHAAKIMAAAATELYSDPEHLKKAREEFDKATMDNPYQSPLPGDLEPPKYENPYRK